jgi:dihydrofolate reductase
MATLVVAMATNRAIGFKNQMPWHLPEDLQHFKRTTLSHTLIMGRKTFDSIGKALPGRRTIVLTRDSKWQHEGCETAKGIAEALQLAQTTPDRHPFIVGGATVYEQTLLGALVNKMIITEIALAPEADAFFPEVEKSQWKEASREPFRSKSGLAYSIVHYTRQV